MNRFSAAFSSLSSRNFRLYFAGHAVSAIGTWMQRLGQAWLVLELSDSGTLLGVAAALQQLPTLLIGPWGGLVSDRVDKRRLIIAVEGMAGILAVILGFLTLTGLVELWMVFALAFGLGVTDAFDRPARKAFVLEMVDPNRLTNAITLSAVVMNGARTVGPAIAGVLIAHVGLPVTFFVNALSYGAVVLGLSLMRRSELVLEPPAGRGRGQVREGIAHVVRNPGLAGPILLMTIAGLLAFEWNVTLPLLARDVFGDDPQTFGLLFSAVGIGAAVGGVAIAAVLKPSIFALLVAASAFSGIMMTVALTPSLGFALVSLALLGAASITFKTQTQSIAQLRAAPHMRGRVAALVTVATAGTTPLGGPLAGWLGETYGARITFVVGSLGTLAAIVVVGRYLWRHGEVRRGADEGAAAVERRSALG